MSFLRNYHTLVILKRVDMFTKLREFKFWDDVLGAVAVVVAQVPYYQPIVPVRGKYPDG